MKAFELFLNGKLLATAGIGNGFLSTILSYPQDASDDDFRFHVGGIDEATGEMVSWEVPTPHVGDEVTIRLVETNHLDRPSLRRPRDQNLVAEIAKRREARRWATGG